MKFLCLSLDDPETLRTPPTPEKMAAIGAFMAETSSHIFLTGGVEPSEVGVRITYTGGRRSIVDGPYAESKELIAGFAILEVDSKEEAIAFVSRFAEIAGIRDMEVRQLYLQQDMAALAQQGA